MPFQRGNTLGKAGRTPSIKTQLKRFEQKHPEAYDKLMEILYEKGLTGSSIDAQYVIDRIKGKPKVQIGLDEADRELLSVATILEFRKLMDRPLLKEGEYAITRGSQEAVSEGLNEEEEV